MNAEQASRCAFCDAPLGSSDEWPSAPGVSLPDEADPNADQDWRREVARRLEAFRARRRGRSDETQSALPFGNRDKDDESSLPEDDLAIFLPADSEIGSTSLKPQRRQRVDIDVAQPGLDFAGTLDSAGGFRPRRGARTDAALLPVALLSARRRAGLIDAGLVLLAYAGFLFLFGALGGRFTLSKFTAAISAATIALFYVQYFVLFTALGGLTPGMLLCRLRVVGFDGEAPTARQLLWRSFGYLLSGGTMLLGFLWSLWDEDHLTWHDRISQTYLTATPPTTDALQEASTAITEAHRLAHK